MSLLYQSTRGIAPPSDLEGVILRGLAPDGGLYVPSAWPQIEMATMVKSDHASYLDVALAVMRPFVSQLFDDKLLRKLLNSAYQSFDTEAVTPLKVLEDGTHVLELFHGPTFAFKDIALQFLGEVFGQLLSQSQSRMTVIGATSGDTGSAAMHALSGRKNIDVFILYPAHGPSTIQRKQMTCIEAPNVHALAIDGTFDDCQALVKELFNDETFSREQNLTAVNSINWLRILAQMVYYFVTALRLKSSKSVSFVVPTGNFGNIYAAYAAMRCGLDVSKLAIASNRNDILTRFFTRGSMKIESVQTSLSPSMDIQNSSNFERLLFDLCQRDGRVVKGLMDEFRNQKEYQVSNQQLAEARKIFTASSIDDELTLSTMRDVYNENGYILDPHSAVAMATARELRRELPQPVVVLACAHPAKFPETVERAIGLRLSLPPSLEALIHRPERIINLTADLNSVRQCLKERVKL